MVKSQVETPHSYIIPTPQGEYRGNHLYLKEAAIPTTIPESGSTMYNTKVSLQPMQRNACIKPLSPIKESSNNNTGNSNVSAQCALTLQSVPNVERLKSKNLGDHPGYQNHLSIT